MQVAKPAGARMEGNLSVVLSLLIIIGCAFIVARPVRLPTLANVANPDQGVPATPFTALVVFQEKDCESNLQILHLFERPSLRPAFSARGVLLPSSRRPDRRLEALVRHAYPSFEFRRAARGDARTLHALGFQRTPYLVVLDQGGRVRFRTTPPPTPAYFVLLARELRQLAEAQPGSDPRGS
jgi:hypothetical protein